MLAKLKTAGSVVGSLMRFAGVNTGNEVGVPFFIRGTTSKPKFIPDAKGAASGILDSALSGKGAKPGDNSQGQPLSDALRGLFKKEETAISPIKFREQLQQETADQNRYRNRCRRSSAPVSTTRSFSKRRVMPML